MKYLRITDDLALASFKPIHDGNYKLKAKVVVVVTGTIAAGYCGYRVYTFVRHVNTNRAEIAERLRQWISIGRCSRLISWLSAPVQPDYRQMFKDCSVERTIQHAELKNHSHPDAAVTRCYANTAMSNFIVRLGRSEYSVSMSNSEQQAGKAGTRVYHHAKDMVMDYQHDKLTSDHVVKMTDVDYYVDMSTYLRGNPALIYTFVPMDVAGSTSNGSYRVVEGNNVETHIVGGGHYIHPLWDYETDHLVVDHWWGSSFYLVEQKSLTDDRRLIFLNPVRNVYTPLAWLIPGYRLRRRRLVHDNIAYVKSMRTLDTGENVVTHSFALLRENTSARVDDKTLTTVRGRLMHMTKPTMSDIERILRVDNTSDAHVVAAILYQVAMNPVLSELVYANPHYPITKYRLGDNSYTPLGRNVLESGKPTLRQITEPYMLDAAHATRSENSDASCIQGRVLDVKNPVQKVPPFYYTCLNEFACFLIPDEVANTLVPQDYSFMYNQWNRPTQRRLLDSVKHLLFYDKPFFVKSFQKAEAYAKITYPRNISTLPTGHNARMGQFAYVLSENVLKKAHWYAFGKHPRVVADEVHSKISKSESVVPSDLSFMDGSNGPFQTDVVETVAVRAFADPYKHEFTRGIRQEARAHGFTTHGIHYLAEHNTLSGSSMTSVRNSIILGSHSYIALRISGLKPIEAYERLGMYGGDDGITCDVDPALLRRVFAKCGLLLKTEQLREGDPVPFLGRYFIDPWTTPACIADVPRQLRKLHLTATPSSVPTEVVLQRKAEAILVTDSATPVLSDWAQAVLRVVNVSERERQRHLHFTARDVSYWIKYEDPFPPHHDTDLLNDVVSKQFGGNLQVIVLIAKLRAARTLTDLEHLVDDTTPNVIIPAVFNGQVVTPKAPPPSRKQQLKQNLKAVQTRPGNQRTPRTSHKQPPPKGKRAKSPLGNRCRYVAAGKPCPRANCTFCRQ